MSPAYCLTVVCFIPLLISCASTQPYVVAEPVGPPPASTHVGFLKVYSAREPYNNDGIDSYPPHTGYTIYSADGKVFKYVQNHMGLFDAGPTVVTLPAGTYKVVAKADRYEKVTVPVMIEEGQTTSIYLEDSGMSNIAQVSESDLVRLPDGTIVGWRAKTLPKANEP